MVAIRHDLDIALAGGSRRECLGWVGVGVFLVSADIQDRAGYFRRQFQRIGHFGQAVEEAFGRNDIPPAWHKHQRLASAIGHHRASLRRDFLQPISCQQAGATGALDSAAPAAVGGQQHQRGSPGVRDGMRHREHAAVAVADDNRLGKSLRRHPGGRNGVVLNAFMGQLKRRALGRSAIANGQNIVAAAVEGQADEAELRQSGRQEPGAPM